MTVKEALGLLFSEFLLLLLYPEFRARGGESPYLEYRSLFLAILDAIEEEAKA